MGGFTNFSLQAYQGPWTTKQASHLLRRTMYGSTNEDISVATELGLEQSINTLTAERDMPSHPINYYYQRDPLVPVGSTWVDKPFTRGENRNQIINSRLRSLRAWSFGQAMEEGFSIREKMTLFWYNHFVTADLRDAKFRYQNQSYYRENFLGNFKDMVKHTNVNPSMLRYLNGNQNTQNKPNENYARELLELFTIGKGPQVAEGDYTHYTEEDILQIARVLTGWRDVGYLSPERNTPASIFRQGQHDQGIKTLSHRFNHTEIYDLNSIEHEHLIDIIFEQDEVARHIVRKLYRWFVYYEISDQVEQEIIEPLAQILIANDYEIKPVVEALLMSEHFYDEYAKGCQIKNPIDFVVGIMKQLRIEIPSGTRAKYNIWLRLAGYCDLLQMSHFNAPSVAGWKAYYQPPLFYRTWINSTTLSNRLFFSSLMLQGIENDELNLQTDLLKLIETFESASDPNALIDYLVSHLLPKEITEGQKNYLKSILIPGLPDFEWTLEYDLYLSNPENAEMKMAVENRLKGMMYALLSLPEFQLS